MEFPPAAQWAKDAVAAYRDGPQRSSHSPRAPLIFVNDLGSDGYEDVYPLLPSDTDQTIADYKRQIRFPHAGMNKGGTLYQLANAYRRRWLEKARSEDLNDAILGLWYSLLNTPQGSRETAGTLEEFCYLLHRRFDGTGEGGNIVGQIEYVKSEISKRNFGDDLFLSRLLEVLTELENMIERYRLSGNIQQQAREDTTRDTGNLFEAWGSKYQQPEYAERPKRMAGYYFPGMNDRPSAPLRDRQKRQTLHQDDDVDDDRPSAPFERATERILSSLGGSFGRLLDKVLPDDPASTVSRSSSSSGD